MGDSGAIRTFGDIGHALVGVVPRDSAALPAVDAERVRLAAAPLSDLHGDLVGHAHAAIQAANDVVERMRALDEPRLPPPPVPEAGKAARILRRAHLASTPVDERRPGPTGWELLRSNLREATPEDRTWAMDHLASASGNSRVLAEELGALDRVRSVLVERLPTDADADLSDGSVGKIRASYDKLPTTVPQIDATTVADDDSIRPMPLDELLERWRQGVVLHLDTGIERASVLDTRIRNYTAPPGAREWYQNDSWSGVPSGLQTNLLQHGTAALANTLGSVLEQVVGPDQWPSLVDGDLDARALAARVHMVAQQALDQGHDRAAAAVAGWRKASGA